MNTLLIFFAFPIAVIIISILLQKLFNNPIGVAAFIFAIFIVVTFAAFDETFLIATLAYTILAFLTAFFVSRFCNSENNNNSGCGLCNGALQALQTGVNNTSNTNNIVSDLQDLLNNVNNGNNNNNNNNDDDDDDDDVIIGTNCGCGCGRIRRYRRF